MARRGARLRRLAGTIRRVWMFIKRFVRFHTRHRRFLFESVRLAFKRGKIVKIHVLYFLETFFIRYKKRPRLFFKYHARTRARRSSFLSCLISKYIYLVFVLRLDVRRVDLLGLSAAFFSLVKNMTAMDAKSNANCIVRLPTGSLRKVMWK